MVSLERGGETEKERKVRVRKAGNERDRKIGRKMKEEGRTKGKGETEER